MGDRVRGCSAGVAGYVNRGADHTSGGRGPPRREASDDDAPRSSAAVARPRQRCRRFEVLRLGCPTGSVPDSITAIACRGLAEPLAWPSANVRASKHAARRFGHLNACASRCKMRKLAHLVLYEPCRGVCLPCSLCNAGTVLSLKIGMPKFGVVPNQAF
eukprot:358045-Chlamydomonas_euryale.AAC.1